MLTSSPDSNAVSPIYGHDARLYASPRLQLWHDPTFPGIVTFTPFNSSGRNCSLKGTSAARHQYILYKASLVNRIWVSKILLKKINMAKKTLEKT